MNKITDEQRAMIVEAIAKSGLSKVEFCKKAGVNFSTLHSFLLGKRSPQLKVLYKILSVAGIDMKNFLS